jgi:hypothetical protein
MIWFALAMVWIIAVGVLGYSLRVERSPQEQRETEEAMRLW